jgi:tetratricopeptide (TPR) repeat protein
MGKFIGLPAILFLAVTMSSAQSSSGQQFEQLRRDGFDALYNLDYETARLKFNEIVRQFPDHPAGPQFLAATLWTKTLNESRRLQSSLYNSDSFYAGSEDKPDPKIVSEFRDLTRNAKRLAEARLKTNPKDVESLYFLGAVEGLRAAWATTVQRSFIGALRDGSNSVDRDREVIKLDPNYHDAELTIGLYDYVVGSLPLPIKILASIGGFRGSKTRGLATLERVAKEGKFANDDARSLLIVLYKREKRFEDALAISRDLGNRYTRNYLYKLESADALISMAARDRNAGRIKEADSNQSEALTIFDSMLRDRTTRETAMRSLDLIHFRYGDALLTAGQSEAAAKEFLAASTTSGAEATLATMAVLRAAQAYDVSGKRNEALAQYRIVLERPDVYDSHDSAKRGIKEPYKIIKSKNSD